METHLDQYSGTRFEFYPEVYGKPLKDFMWAREIIKLNVIKSFA